jgi:very-short-patch-repair endonuclease
MKKVDFREMNDKDFNVNRYGEDVKLFEMLPERAKLMALLDLGMFEQWKGWNTLFEVRAMKSPIEMIFSLAFELSKPDMDDSEIPSIYLTAQQEIKVGKKTYFADFVFDSDVQFFDVYEGKHKKLVIECDGHEFHERTKEQVRKDNERQYDLKMAGYDVLRFSGSEIFNTPYACAEKAISYIKKLIKEEKK